MRRYRGRRPRTMTDIGPYFSTDAGGQPQGSARARPFRGFGMGQTPGTPPIALPEGLGVDLPLLLRGIPVLATLTPWAEQVSDIQWNEIHQPPEFNVTAYEYGLVEYAMRSFGMGPAGFVAVLTPRWLTLGQAEAMYTGTPYKLFSGQAVYRQDDSAPLPTAFFLYWGQLRDPGDQSGGGGSVDTAAASVGGTLLWGVEVQGGGRPVPSGTFQQAFDRQWPGIHKTSPWPTQTTPPNGMTPVTTPPNGGQPPPASLPPAKEKASMVGPVLVGFGVAALTFLAVRSMKR